MLDVLHSNRFVDRSPASVFAALLDEGVYHCSTRTMYRILHDSHEVRERRNQLRRPNYKKPDAPSAHPRSGYPSPGCVPAEPDSVSPNNVNIPDQAPNQQPPSDTRAHALKNPGGVGAGPHIQTKLLAKRDQLH